MTASLTYLFLSAIVYLWLVCYTQLFHATYTHLLSIVELCACIESIPVSTYIIVGQFFSSNPSFPRSSLPPRIPQYAAHQLDKDAKQWEDNAMVLAARKMAKLMMQMAQFAR